MFQLAGQIFLGLIVGTLAKLIISGEELGGVMVTALIGLAGSVIGTFVGHYFFGLHLLIEWIFSLAGAIATLYLYRQVVHLRTGSESTVTHR